MCDKSDGFVRPETVQDIDRRAAAEGLAQGNTFAQAGNEEGFRAVFRQVRGDPGHAETVSIGLDHGGRLGRAGALLQDAEIMQEGGEIDIQPRRWKLGRHMRPLASLAYGCQSR